MIEHLRVQRTRPVSGPDLVEIIDTRTLTEVLSLTAEEAQILAEYLLLAALVDRTYVRDT